MGFQISNGVLKKYTEEKGVTEVVIPDSVRRMDMSANTFYRRVREYEIRHGIAEPTSA